MTQKQRETGPEPTPLVGAQDRGEIQPPVGETVSLGGGAPAMEGATETIAERLRHAEEALAIVERRFQSTVDRVADGILVVDHAGKIRFTNPAGARVFGRSPEELIGSELGVPLVAGETTQIDLRTPNGSRIAELRVADTTWENGDALLLSVRDVTDRREAEERERTLLREQLARVQAEETAARARVLAEASRILSSSNDQDQILAELAKMLAATIADACLLDVSADPGRGRYLKVVARRGPEGVGEVTTREGASAAGPPSPLAKRLFESLGPERTREPGPGWIQDVATTPDDAELWESLGAGVVIVAPLITGAGPLGLMAVASASPTALGEQDEALLADLAQRTSLALENVRLLRLAEEASRAKSDFLAIISHELRTPLTGITGYAALLAEGVERPLTDREARYVDGIQRCADRLLGIIDQLLLFARSRSGRDKVQYGTVSLAELIDAVAEVARPLAKESGLQLTVRTVERHVQVTTDPEMVRHILLHLLTNAIKFTPSGNVTLEADVRGGMMLLRVTDTGRGIPEDKLAAIFEPFSQAEAPHTRTLGGTGIGLNLVQNLVRMLGGDIEVSSAPGHGSTFTVRLPQPRAQNGPPTLPPPPQPPRFRSRGTGSGPGSSSGTGAAESPA